jgi:alcohol dehydrogenase class IV
VCHQNTARFITKEDPVTVEVNLPSIMTIGAGALAEVPAILKNLRCTRPLMVTDEFLLGRGIPAQLRDAIVESGIECAIFSDTVPDPTTDLVEAGVRTFTEGKHDSLVSIGGGSPIDTAKAIAMLAANQGTVRQYKVPNVIPNAVPVHVAIPTTAGTGSEVTRFTVITDSATGEKMLIAGSVLVPKAAVVDYTLTMSMPPRLTGDTGTDSLTHAIEAYVSRKANRFTDTFALSAMKTIWQQLPTAFREPGNKEAREAMMLAATLAGIAFSNASVALVHGMSRPIGAFFHVPHGLSNAMLLPAVTAFSINSAVQRYAECARAMQIARSSDSDQASASKLVKALYQRNLELEVPTPSKYGISQESYFKVIPTMAAQALASGSPQNNPRVPTIAEIEQLYEEVW